MTETFDDLAQRLAAVGHPTRLRLLALLNATGEALCVCELSDGLGIPDYQTSRHLKALSAAGWVSHQRDGLWIYYRLADTPLLIDLASSLEPLPDDLGRTRVRLEQRHDGRCVIGPSSQEGK